MYDHQMAFSEAQALTTTAASTNILDLTDLLHQIGQAAKHIKVRVDVHTTFAGSMTSANFALQSGPTATTLYDTPLKISNVLKAALVAGVTVLRANLPETGDAANVGNAAGFPPPGPSPLRRFLGMNYTINGGACTGAVDAFLESD